MNNAHRIVSSEAEELILVDADDNETGFLSKGECHDGSGVLHRAFSLFLFNDAGELLLQRRSAAKRLWPGYWSNSICSHPRRGESMQVATQRRLHDELNIRCDLEFIYKFVYQAEFSEAGSEHELCHVYLGRIQGDVRPNDREIQDIRYVSVSELEREFDEARDHLTPWFKLEWCALVNDYRDRLAKYTTP